MDLRIDLPGDLAAIPRSAEWIEELASPRGYSPELVYRLELCLEEALGNAILHGSAANLAASLEEDGVNVTLRIEDDGHPFDPTAVEERELPESIDVAPVGGLGLRLLRRFSSAITYEHAAGRNRLSLRFPKA